MSKKHQKLESLNFWPGYVDALINVVLNLLFMVAIFAVGVFCMGIQAQLHPKRGGEPIIEADAGLEQKAAGSAADQESKEKKQSADDLTAKAKQPPIVFQVKGVTSSTPNNLVEQELIKRISEGKKTLTVKFNGNQNTLTGDMDAALAKEVLAVGDSKGVWKVWAQTSTTDPNQRRELYMRMTAVRAALMRANVNPKNIDMDLFEDPQIKGAPKSQVHILFKQGN
jgi:hypothetical protein